MGAHVSGFDPADPQTNGAGPSTEPKRNTARHALGGMVWSGLGFGAQGIGQFLVVIVFARYLTKTDNGVVAAALIVIALGQLFTEAGFGPAVVQREELTDEHIRSAFALSLLTGACMTIVIYVTAPLIADFFHQSAVEPVMHGLAFTFMLQAPGVVAMALLQRSLDFKSIAIAETVSYFVGFAGVGVVLAISGVGVFSIVFAQLAQAALLTGILLLRRPHPKALRPRKQESIDLVVYAGGMTAARAFNFVALYGDNTVVGNRMSAADLGAYKNAYQLAAVPAQLLGQVMDRVIFPVLSRLQERRDRVASAYLRGIALVAMITIPASIVVVLLGPEVIHLLLGGGTKWDDAIVPFQIFAAGLIFRTSYKISDSLARAMGTVYRRAWRQAVYAGAVIVGALIGTTFGLVWVAVGVTAAIVLNYLLMADLSIRTVPIGWWQFAVRQTRGLYLGVVVGIVSVPTVLALRSADVGNFLTILGTLVVASLALLLSWRLAPGVTLGDDGAWIVNVIKSRRDDDPPAPISLEVTA
jgi:O-antigen/teichoic acid export membrane protein